MSDEAPPFDAAGDEPLPMLPGDLPDPQAGFDPTQWAMHGLLAAHYEDSPSDRERRARAILDRILTEAPPSEARCYKDLEAPVAHATHAAAPPAEVPQQEERSGDRDLGLTPPWQEGTDAKSRATDAAESGGPRGDYPFLPPGEADGRPAAFLPRFRPWAHPRRWLLTGLAAASLVAAVTVFWRGTPRAMADIYADAANAGTAMFYFARDLTGLFDDDPAAAEQHRKTTEAERRKLREALDAVAKSPEPVKAPVLDVLFAWQGLYCAYRDVGLFEESVRENLAALAYVAHNPSGRRAIEWECVFLDGLGNTYAAFGDYEAARKAYMDSIALRRQLPREFGDPHAGEPGYEGHRVHDLALLYLRLVMLSVSLEDLQEADQWQARAERTLRESLCTVCELNGIALPDHATLWDAWNALPAEFQQPHAGYSNEEVAAWPSAWRVYGPVPTWLQFCGAVLYHEAILARLRGDVAAAQQALDRAGTFEDWLTRNPGNDEYRLPFVMRLERARLAIIRKDYAGALSHLDQAEQYVAAVQAHAAAVEAGEVVSQPIPDVNKLPLSPARRAELNLLRGVALLGLDPASDDGARLVRRALATPVQLAAGLPPEQREAFLKQFESWQQLATQTAPTTKQSSPENGGLGR